MTVLAPVLRDWYHSALGVTVTLRESSSPSELHRLLDDDEVDLLLRDAPAPDRFVSTPFAEEEVVLVTPVDHPSARQSVVRLTDIDGVDLVHYAPDNGLSAWLDGVLHRAGVRPEPVVRTSVSSAAPQLAVAGLGVAVCPTSALTEGLPGAVRSFSPRWTQALVAVTRGEPDPSRSASSPACVSTECGYPTACPPSSTAD